MPGPTAPAGGVYPFGAFGGSFGLALNDRGQVLFAATVGGTQSLILATPKRSAGGVGLAEKSAGIQPHASG
jgi:hypothetical protein